MDNDYDHYDPEDEDGMVDLWHMFNEATDQVEEMSFITHIANNHIHTLVNHYREKSKDISFIQAILYFAILEKAHEDLFAAYLGAEDVSKEDYTQLLMLSRKYVKDNISTGSMQIG